jgi:hypothetical protein
MDIRMPFAGKRIEEEVIKAKATAEGLIVINTRRGSGNGIKANGSGKKEEGSSDDKKTDPSIEQQYSTALGYSLDALSDMLTPPRSACNRRFELNADEVVFIGHPVSIDSDGQWRFPEETAPDEPIRGEERGRRREAVGQSHLRTVVESSEGAPTPEVEKSDPLGDDDCPTLNMFHLVVLVDKPESKMPTLGHDGVTPSDKLDEVYREIAFKWTAAAYDLQVRTNFIAKESWEMAKVRERFMTEGRLNIVLMCGDEACITIQMGQLRCVTKYVQKGSCPGQSIVSCAAYMYHYNPLEHALQDLALALHNHRHTPVNPLYSHLPSTLSVDLSGTGISMTLAPRYEQMTEPWARWDATREDDAESSISSNNDNDDFADLGDIDIQPWQTLLLVDNDTKLRAKEVASLIVGTTGQATGVNRASISSSGRSSSPSAAATEVRRESHSEEDETVLMTALILACDVTKP